MKTINIKNKEYVPVVERVKEFHRIYPGGQIITEILPSDDGRVVVKAKVSFNASVKGEPYVTFTGHSQAVYGEGIMGNVALEVAETSAIGRALGFANIGILDGIASADEMRKVGKAKVGDSPEDDDLGF